MDRRCSGILSILLFILAAAIGGAAQVTINVPADVATIQGAINAANNGDTVLVAPGTYVENLNFLGKAITVVSANGPASTIIDGGGKAPVVQFVSNEPPTAILDGFTIRHGYEQWGDGAGVKISYAAPTVRNNIITANTGCNTSAVYAQSSAATIANNTISNNGDLGTGCGGGTGAGISIGGSPRNGQTQIIGNTIRNNVMRNGSGGGIALNGAGNAVLQNNLVIGNSAFDTGGIWIANYASELVVGNIIVDNVSELGNGRQVSGLYISVPSGQPGPYLLNNTISSGTQAGTAVYFVGFFATTQLTNNIIFGNSSSVPVHCDPLYGSQPPIFRYNDVYSPAATAMYDGSCTDQTGSNGNISADPVFLDAARSDYHLQARSPAIDAGDSSAPSLPNADFDGKPRVVDGNNDGSIVVDMGAYEFDPASSAYAALSPAAANFTTQNVGTTSAPFVFTLANSGMADLTIWSIAVTAPFAATSNCPAVLAAGTQCAIQVTFSPVTGGPASGTLTVNSNAALNPVTAALTGNGNSAMATLSPSSAEYGTITIGGGQAYRTLTLTNTGGTVLNLSSISTAAPFFSTNNCGATLVSGASCSITVAFHPTEVGTFNGVLTVTSSAVNNPVTATLNGSAVAPTFAVSPSSLSFGAQLVGTTSSSQPLTLSNPTATDLGIMSIVVAPPFSQTNDCGYSLAAGASCTINVTFSPTAMQNYATNVGISGSDFAATLVPVTGTGVAPIASITPTVLSFGQQLVGTTSLAKSVAISNLGDAPLTISSVAVTGSFQQTNSCSAPVAPGASCTVNVSFVPTARGTASGALSITHDAAGSPATVSLSGSGIAPVISLSPAALNFGSQRLSTTSAGQYINIGNTGDAVLTISSITTGAEFPMLSSCAVVQLGPGATCTLTLAFTPAALGLRTGTLTISDNATGAPHTVPLSGYGVDFGLAVNPATTARGDSVATPYTVSPLGGPYPYAVGLSCSGLPRATTCSFDFNPATPGVNGATGTLTISTSKNTPVGTYTVGITGVSGTQQHTVALTLTVTK